MCGNGRCCEHPGLLLHGVNRSKCGTRPHFPGVRGSGHRRHLTSGWARHDNGRALRCSSACHVAERAGRAGCERIRAARLHRSGHDLGGFTGPLESRGHEAPLAQRKRGRGKTRCGWDRVVTEINAEGVRLAFGRTIALAGLDVTLSSGEVIGIAGPNGAGKSTFTRVLAGEARADAGIFSLDGQPWTPQSDMKTVAVVHQEPQVWPNLTVVKNLLVGQEGKRRGKEGQGDRVGDVLESLGLVDVATTQLDLCSFATRQRVEIGRAMLRQARCYIFDEPNSALTDEESEALFAFMQSLAAEGHIAILISHRLGDLVDQCGVVHVIRDGIVAKSLRGSSLTEANIASELVKGSEPSAAVTSDSRSEVVTQNSLRIRQWSSESDEFRSIDLDLIQGQVTAVVGVEGSGGREFVASVAGYHPARGDIAWDVGQLLNVVKSTAFLPADRKGILFGNMSVGDNIVSRLGSPRLSRKSGVLRLRESQTIAEQSIAAFGVKTEGPKQLLTALSGGNQQKVAIASALTYGPSVLAIEEPTRGVDVGSKRDIYATLQQAARSGMVVLLFCTEIPEVYEAAHRVLVMDRGAVVKDLKVSDFDEVTALAQSVALAEHTA
ncbi:MAG: sugar ABC transporter ATP-binding protein [Actinobacteria bacterium]|nr:sugar ABC transporter ATP-binding protein [Actinomycetota bacterium]